MRNVHRMSSRGSIPAWVPAGLLVMVAVAGGCRTSAVADTSSTPKAVGAGGEASADESGRSGDPRGMGLRKGLLLPPSEPGTARVRLAGCLQDTGPGDDAGVRHPVAPTRGPSRDEVRVHPTVGGVLVSHDLAHACCLVAAVDVKVEGKAIRVVETLSGTPCRCMCSSTIQTAVGVGPGDYELKVVLADSGGQRPVHEGRVTVPATRAR